MPLGLRTIQLALELINMTTPSDQIMILTGHTLYMVMSMKFFLMACNRILSKVQNSFWSCTHVNSC